jgi:hypothetical protein
MVVLALMRPAERFLYAEMLLVVTGTSYPYENVESEKLI